jgi:hypothetical protein
MEAADKVEARRPDFPLIRKFVLALNMQFPILQNLSD